MPSLQDLGQIVKQKYPGAYDNVPDVELARTIQQKYPGAYDQFTDSQSTGQGPESLTKVGGALGVAGDVVGVHHLGELLGSIGFFRSKDKKSADQSATDLQALTDSLYARAMQKPAGSEERKRLLKIAQENSGQVSDYQGSIAASAPTGKEVASDVAQLALTAVGAKIPKATGVLRASADSLKGMRGATNPLMQVLLSNTGQGAFMGGAYGANTAFGRGGSAGDIGKSAATGSALGVLFGMLTGSIGKGVRVMKDKAARQQYASSLGLPVDDPAVTAGLRNNVSGSYHDITAATKSSEGQLEKTLQKAAEDSGASLSLADVARDPIVQRKYKLAMQTAGGDLRANKVLANLLNGGEELPTGQFGQTAIPDTKTSLADFLDLRRQLDESSRYNDQTNTGNVLKDLATAVKNRMRGMISNASPEVGALLDEQGQAITIKNAAQKMLEKPAKGLTIHPLAIVRRAALNPQVATRGSSGAYRAFTSDNAQTLARALALLGEIGIGKGAGN